MAKERIINPEARKRMNKSPMDSRITLMSIAESTLSSIPSNSMLGERCMSGLGRRKQSFVSS